MFTWYIDAFKRSLDFSGRTDRRSYWYFILGMTIVSLCGTAVDTAATLDGLIKADHSALVIGKVAKTIAALHALPLLAINVRRLHDVGKSGVWVALALVPYIGWATLAAWYARPSQGASSPGAGKDVRQTPTRTSSQGSGFGRAAASNWSDRVPF